MMPWAQVKWMRPGRVSTIQSGWKKFSKSKRMLRQPTGRQHRRNEGEALKQMALQAQALIGFGSW